MEYAQSNEQKFQMYASLIASAATKSAETAKESS
jgi:hypothetical protein